MEPIEDTSFYAKFYKCKTCNRKIHEDYIVNNKTECDKCYKKSLCKNCGGQNISDCQCVVQMSCDNLLCLVLMYYMFS